MSEPRFRPRLYRTEGSGPPEDLEFGDVAFSDGDDSLHIGKLDGSVVSKSLVKSAVFYTPVVPRVLELNGVVIPTDGQIYQLSAVPSDRPVIALLQVHCGLPAAASWLSIICEPIKANQSAHTPAGWDQMGDSVSYLASLNDLSYPVRMNILVPTANGQIFASRQGTYYAGVGSNIWSLGYFDGINFSL